MRPNAFVHIAKLLLVLTASTCLAQSVQPSLSLEVVAGVPVVNGLFLNGQGPYRFILDTGSDSNQVESRLAQKIGIPDTLQLEEVTPSGISHVRGGVATNVALGDATASDQEFLLVTGDSFHALNSNIRGILGQQFLRHFDYTLDFQHHRITFGHSPARGERVKFRLVSSCMVVSTDLGELMIDSGSQNLFLFRDIPFGQNTRFASANGFASATLQRAPSFSLAGHRYYPTDVLIRHVSNAPADGLIPATLFHAIQVSNAEGYLIFNPTGKP